MGIANQRGKRMSLSPLADPFIAALFTHHRELAPPALLKRLLPVPIQGTEESVSPDFEAMKAKHRDANKVVFLPVKPVVDQAKAIVNRCGLAEPTVALILHEVCTFYEVSKLAVLSGRRTLKCIRPRQVAMYLSRELTTQTLPQVGRFLGGKDHTTVLHGCRAVDSRIKLDERLADEIDIIKLRILNQLPAEEAA